MNLEPILDVEKLRSMSDEEFLAQCEWETFRGSGPGGQKRNKTSSAVRVRHIPSTLTAVASELRSQAQNKQAALRRLRMQIAMSIRQKVDPATFAPPAWFDALRDASGKVRVSERNENYLPTLALVLDVVEAMGGKVADSAALLRINSGNLIKLIKTERVLMAHVHKVRAAAGLNPLY